MDNNIDEATQALIAQMMGADGDAGFQVVPLTSSPNVNPDCICGRAFEDNEAESLFAAPCTSCGDVGENWVCLCCRAVLCSRYRNGCAVAHASSVPDHHCIHLSFSDLSVWDHKLESYLDVFAMPLLQPSFGAFHQAKFNEPMKIPTLTLDIVGGGGEGLDDGDDGGGKPAANQHASAN